RARLLRELARTDPAEALRLMLAEDVLERLREDFPEQAGVLEQHGEWEGPVETIVLDEEDLTGHDIVHHLKTGEETLEVHLAGIQPEGIQCGRRVRFRGVRVGEVAAAMDGEVVAALDGKVAAADAAATPACGPGGPQKIAVLLVTFPGIEPPGGVTPAGVHSILFGPEGRSLHGYWNEASFGNVSATGTVLGWYTLDKVYSCSEYYAMRNAAVAAADADIDFRNYNRLFIIFPNPGGCPWAGLSNVGCGSFSSADGTISASSSWMLATYFSSADYGVRLSAHEGGHALGLMHSRSRRFDGEPLGAPGTAGTISEYGDLQSAMGSWNLGHYTAEQKAKLGWLAPSNVLQVQTAGSFVVKPLEAPAGGSPQALQIQRGTGGNAWLWLEFRQPLGNYDTTLNSQIFSGALIHYKDSATGSYTDLLDFTPSTTAVTDAALPAGTTWQDPYTNLSLTVTSASASGFSVNVSYGSAPCTAAPPTLSLSPPNPGAEPGGSAGYTVTLKNNDSANCSSRTFDFSSSKPEGWLTSFASPSVTLVPGQTVNVAMTKSVPAAAAAGTYEVDVIARSGTDEVSAAASLTVALPPPPPPLTVSFNQSAATLTARSTVQFSALVLSGDQPAKGASVVFTMRRPDGSTTASRSIKTDAAGIASWSYRFQNKDPRGSYTVTATATYNGQSARAATTVTLQ
ncbi:MAG: NEW3 domain-containing protein, partial [Bryobacteraceae bacterium]